MVPSPHKNFGAIISGTCNSSHVLISLSLKLCRDCFVIVFDNMNEDPGVLCFKCTNVLPAKQYLKLLDWLRCAEELML